MPSPSHSVLNRPGIFSSYTQHALQHCRTRHQARGSQVSHDVHKLSPVRITGLAGEPLMKAFIEGPFALWLVAVMKTVPA